MAKENDVVLIYFEDKPLIFARIEDITADYKKDWYHVKLLMLQIPPQPVTWILRSAYINGEEFTMQGKRMRLEPVVCPPDPHIPQQEHPSDPQESPDSSAEAGDEEDGKAKVISFQPKKK